MGNIDILEKLEEYSKAGYVPMHMPGGKRNTDMQVLQNLILPRLTDLIICIMRMVLLKMRLTGQQNCMGQIKH